MYEVIEKHDVYCVFALQDKNNITFTVYLRSKTTKAVRLLCICAPGQKKHYVYCVFALQDKTRTGLFSGTGSPPSH